MAKSLLQPDAIQLARIHFLFILLFVGHTIVYDASQLISPQAVLQRWELAATLTVLVTVAWYVARIKPHSRGMQKWLISGLIGVDILFISFLVYADRGMASPAVALYAFPLILSTALRNQSAVWATAILSTAAYSYAAIKYFADYFNEGFKVQLYSTIGFYSAALFLFALLLLVCLRVRNDR